MLASRLRSVLYRRRPGWARLALPAAALAWAAAWLLGYRPLPVSGMLHVLVSGRLLALFGGTLMPGRTPLITRLARRIDREYHAGMDGYTRGVTVAWTLFFAGQIAASMLSMLLASDARWSVTVDMLGLPLVAALFAGEYAVRRLRFRQQRHVSLRELVQAVRAGALRD